MRIWHNLTYFYQTDIIKQYSFNSYSCLLMSKILNLTYFVSCKRGDNWKAKFDLFYLNTISVCFVQIEQLFSSFYRIIYSAKDAWIPIITHKFTSNIFWFKTAIAQLKYRRIIFHVVKKVTMYFYWIFNENKIQKINFLCDIWLQNYHMKFNFTSGYWLKSVKLCIYCEFYNDKA